MTNLTVGYTLLRQLASFARLGRRSLDKCCYCFPYLQHAAVGHMQHEGDDLLPVVQDEICDELFIRGLFAGQGILSTNVVFISSFNFFNFCFN